MVKPDKDKIRERLRVLREHRWSSYRGYGNYGTVPEWLVTGEILDRAGSKERYRHFLQAYVTRGIDHDEFTAFSERVAIGSREFLDRARSWVKSVTPEHLNRSFVASRIPFNTILKAVEQVKGEPFEEFRNRHGDWGLSMIFYLARKRSGLTLSQLGEKAGGMGYKTVFSRMKYLERRMRNDAQLREVYKQCKERLAIRET